jgi:hypothetical protein
MQSPEPGDRVSVTDDNGAIRDGIVFEVPSRTKVIVALADPRRGPVFRTVRPQALSERDADGPHEPALHLLIRRTAPPARGGGAAATGIGHRQDAHTRAAMHRTTGK